MAAESDLAKKAKALLDARMEPVTALGKLLEEKATKERELEDLVHNIDKSYTRCLEAGWKADEMAELGIAKPGKRRQPKAAAPAAPAPLPPPPVAP
ncbi:MAG: hypothetical protein O2892_18380 [Actinomycetota bacterium]|nr:hypothetical protein [Actinomycetota bacterium]MDA2950972.1 hypothetical protein [Actinomycetota bacterium]